MFLLRCRFAEEERNVLLQVRKEMSEEFKDARRKLEESLREMEILKRKTLRLEEDNKHLVRITVNDTHLIELLTLTLKITEMKGVERE